MHAEAPRLDWYMPAMQGEQLAEAAGEFVPREQATQVSDVGDSRETE